ncbi:transposase, partial [Photorhabdus sp. RW14-46]|nr:transposase [Photorhabdus sp. RW14-46]
STHHQRFTFVRLFDPYLIGSCPTFSHLAHHHVS